MSTPTSAPPRWAVRLSIVLVLMLMVGSAVVLGLNWNNPALSITALAIGGIAKFVEKLLELIADVDGLAATTAERLKSFKLLSSGVAVAMATPALVVLVVNAFNSAVAG